MTDNKFQFTPKPINTTIQATHSNAFSDVAVYGVYMETTTGSVKERTLIFETNEKGLADSVLADYQATTYLHKAKFDIIVKYIKHPIIEDGYYTYSHIYDTGKVIKYTIYNFPETYNIADIVSDWQEYVVHYTTTHTHWNFVHYMYSDHSDGSDMYEQPTNPNTPKPAFIGQYVDGLEYKSKLHPNKYTWTPFDPSQPFPVENHSTFTFTSNVFDTLETVQGTSPLNKRNLRHDSWNYQENTTYPFIGGTET